MFALLKIKKFIYSLRLNFQKFNLSFVEQFFLKKSGRKLFYPGENIPIIEVEDSLELGKIVALRFIEWALKNPNGVISLPTGKPPATFIKSLKYYKDYWASNLVSNELKSFGIKSKFFPDTSNLKFVQIDEYFPIKSSDKHSFQNYIEKNYMPVLGIKPHNFLKMNFIEFSGFSLQDLNSAEINGKFDPTLNFRFAENPKEVLQKKILKEVERFCDFYEKRIKEFGGIDFFLGGIGPDGHLAYNMRGSSFESKTRLVTLNFESAAVAAGDFGGISYSREKAAISIGLQTITMKKNGVFIVFASGQLKSSVVIKAIETVKNIEAPTSILQGLPNAKFYLTKDVAANLNFRKIENLNVVTNLRNKFELVDSVIYLQAKNSDKIINDLTLEDFKSSKLGKVFVHKAANNFENFLFESRKRLCSKMYRGLSVTKGLKILHTSPHPDDEILSYFPHIIDLLKNNENYFAYFTNGFRAVPDDYLLSLYNSCDAKFIKENSSLIFQTTYRDLLGFFKSTFAKVLSNSSPSKPEDLSEIFRFEKLVFLNLFASAFELNNELALEKQLCWFFNDYLKQKTPGELDLQQIQKLKGKLRESEIERMWTSLGLPFENIFHLKSKFYTPDHSTVPLDEDVFPVIDLIEKVKPDIITFAFDPKGTHDTHYKVLQIIKRALEVKSEFYKKEKSPQVFPKVVWCYRNVWFKFEAHEEDLAIISATSDSLELLDKTFKTCFPTQKTAEFPSYFYDGPFSELSWKIQKEQFSRVKSLLGEKYLEDLFQQRYKNIEGMIFMKQMSIEDFLKKNNAFI